MRTAFPGATALKSRRASPTNSSPGWMLRCAVWARSTPGSATIRGSKRRFSRRPSGWRRRWTAFWNTDSTYNRVMPDNDVPRRTFLRGVTAATAVSYSRVYGANERVQLGLIGCGERGRGDMGKFVKSGTVDVMALCDIYGAQIDAAKSVAPKAKSFSDHRKMLEMKEVDAVLIGVPDHWHAAIAIDALNAGKDVYVEKPLTLKIEEGPPIVKAARVNNRICQVGMQQRSGKHYLEAKQMNFDTGKLGKVTLARTWWYGNDYHLRTAPARLKECPSNLDWAHLDRKAH